MVLPANTLLMCDVSVPPLKESPVPLFETMLSMIRILLPVDAKTPVVLFDIVEARIATDAEAA